MRRAVLPSLVTVLGAVFLLTTPAQATAVPMATHAQLAVFVGRIPVGNSPDAIAFDSRNGDLYVANSHSNNITVIDGSTQRVVASIPTPWNPAGIVFDPSNGYLYVAVDDDDAYTNCGGGSMAVIDGSNNSVVTQVPLGGCVNGAMALDSNAGLVYAGAGVNLAYLDTTFNLVWGKLPVPDAIPTALAFDASNGLLYGTTCIPPGLLYCGGYVQALTVVNGSNHSLAGQVVIGSGSYGAVFDPSNGYVYVSADGFSGFLQGQVVGIDGATNQVVGSVNVGAGPLGMAVDSQDGVLCVADSVSDNVSLINAATLTIAGTVQVGEGPTAVVYDATDGDVYVADSHSSDVSFFAPSEATHPVSWGILVLAFVGVSAGVVLIAVRLRRTSD